MPTLLRNRKAYYDYEILEKIESGIKLFGHEVRAIKEGKGNLLGTYIKVFDNGLSLLGFNLPLYSKAGITLNYDSARVRRLLVHKEELESLKVKTERHGFTIIPLKFYTKGNIIKLEIGLARGKKKTDKKRYLMEVQQKRDIDRIIKTQKK